ncbi:DUF7010 family protein [Vaginisenegalia massiliensis]|uniref:DUF7010 family protein n=1 Tax=Vaginisenegalia massiliensis TaxID=2058294 RepID=UPI000F524053
MNLDDLRDEVILKQKKGLPFIMSSVVIWLMITLVAALPIDIMLKNILVFSCSATLMPLSWLFGKKFGIDIFSKDNGLGDLGFIFTVNQALYLLIVMWVFNAVPEKMIMVHAMVFGGHLFPYSWLYKSKVYQNFAIIIPILALILGHLFNGFVVAAVLTVTEVIFVLCLKNEMKQIKGLSAN